MAEFLPGLELNRAFYPEVVAPLLGPIRHSAALLGWGSDVLGYDTVRSTDHGWGPRLQVFVAASDLESARHALALGLPETFRGWPVRYGWDDTAVTHHVEVTTLDAWLRRTLGRDPTPEMTPRDWLLTPQQLLLGVTRGAVYRDADGALGRIRRTLARFPDDVWRWLVACQWHRIAQEEAFTGRTAEVGDDLGARVVAGRLVREVMRLSFLLARTYWPYAKWFGTAFGELPVASVLEPALSRLLGATDAGERELALVAVLETAAAAHNASGITDTVDPATRPFHSRTFRVLMADRFTAACVATVTDPWLHGLPLVGSIDQFADSTDVLQFPDRANDLRTIYDASQTRSGPSDPNP